MQLTCSINKGHGSLRHNNRKAIEKNPSWHPELTKNNIVLADRDLHEVYQETFGAAVAAYNAKQKDPRRKISDYYQKIRSSKQENLTYSLCYWVGSSDTVKKGSPEEETVIETLKDIGLDFEKRNAAFKVVQAIIHRDEDGVAHMHVTFVPVSTGNKRGLETKNSLSGAFAAMGYGRRGFSAWRQHELDAASEIMQRHGIELIEGTHEEISLSGPQMKELHEKQQALPKGQEQRILGQKTGKVVLTAEELEKLQNAAKRGLRHEMDKQQLIKLESHRKDQLQELTEKKAAVEARDKAIADRETAVEARERAVEGRERRADVHAIQRENEALRASNEALSAENETLADENDALKKLRDKLVNKIIEIAGSIGYAARRVFCLEGPNGETFQNHEYPDEPSDRIVEAIENPYDEPAKSYFLERE